MTSKIKQVIIVRHDLGMRLGKSIAQGSHASLSSFMKCGKDLIEEWVSTGETKVCLRADSEEELLSIFERASLTGMPCSIVLDEGRTEFKGVPTYTAVAIGPAKSEDIDLITGALKLL